MLLQKRAHTLTNTKTNMVFANHSKEDVMYPFTVKEIAQAQEDDSVLNELSTLDSIPLNW